MIKLFHLLGYEVQVTGQKGMVRLEALFND